MKFVESLQFVVDKPNLPSIALYRSTWMAMDCDVSMESVGIRYSLLPRLQFIEDLSK